MAPSSKSTEGTITPRQAARSPVVANQSPTVEILDSLSSSIARLETDLHNLNNHSPTIDNSLWTEEADKKAIDDLRRKASRYKSEHSTKIDRIKQTVREEYPQIITRELSSEIQELIRKEIQANVNSHFKTQIKDILPVSLQQQLEETNAQLKQAKVALINSESRRNNSTIDISSTDEMLHIVLKPDGKKSDFWPVDLNSLFAYDSEAIKKLLKDYDLALDKVQETNINRFLGHIGVKQQLIL